MKKLTRWGRRRVGEVLERRYGVRTAGRTDLEQLGLDGNERVYYIPANWLTIRRSLSKREVGANDVFIDLGSGMGRMVLEAARYPFKRVIGVELAEQLDAIARENVASTRLKLRCKNIELVCADVLQYEIPDDVTVVFMNNPFRGSVFADTVAKLIASAERNPRQIKVIYANPIEEPALLATGRFGRVRTKSVSPLARVKGTFGSIGIYSLVRPTRDDR